MNGFIGFAGVFHAFSTAFLTPPPPFAHSSLTLGGSAFPRSRSGTQRGSAVHPMELPRAGNRKVNQWVIESLQNHFGTVLFVFFPVRFNFGGDRNISRFIRIAKQNELYVLIRMGPYVCAELEFGGLPWWLIKDQAKVRLRSSETT